MGLIKQLPLNERPREKAYLFGVETLTNQELIAVLLCTGNRENDALELANEIISETKTIDNLSKYTLQELSQFKGIKLAKAMRLKAALEFHFRIEREKNMRKQYVKTILDAANYINSYCFDRNQENLIILLLDKNSKVISLKVLAKGNDEMVNLSMNLIITFALKGCAKKFILAHNHPSNECNPSSLDLEMSNKLFLTSSLVGLEMIDHLILTDAEFYSIFAQNKYFY